DRARWAGFGGELHAGADSADMGLVEELSAWQGGHNPLEPSRARGSTQHRTQARMPASLSGTEETQAKLRLEGEGAARPHLQPGLKGGTLTRGRDCVAFEGLGVT